MADLNCQQDFTLNPGYGEPFVPRRGMAGAHAQTILGHLLTRSSKFPPGECREFQVDACARVACLCHWQSRRQDVLTLLIVHGLEGSCESQYVIGTANKGWAAGMNVVRMNVRTCGGTEALAETLYHSGMSQDIGEVVHALASEEHLSRIALAGFSMGGNQVLKLAGEWGLGAPGEVQAIAAVSPAMDLAASAEALHRPVNRLYELRFLLSLRSRLRRKAALAPGRFPVKKWWWRSIEEFDDCVTAPLSGFRDAQDYYARASASRVIGRIAIPTLVLHAADDPFIRVLPQTRERLTANPCVRFVETEHGGHCGFLAQPADGYDGRWAERTVINFFREHA